MVVVIVFTLLIFDLLVFNLLIFICGTEKSWKPPENTDFYRCVDCVTDVLIIRIRHFTKHKKRINNIFLEFSLHFYSIFSVLQRWKLFHILTFSGRKTVGRGGCPDVPSISPLRQTSSATSPGVRGLSVSEPQRVNVVGRCMNQISMRGEGDYRGREEKNKKIKEKNKTRIREIYIHSYKSPLGE